MRLLCFGGLAELLGQFLTHLDHFAAEAGQIFHVTEWFPGLSSVASPFDLKLGAIFVKVVPDTDDPFDEPFFILVVLSGHLKSWIR